MGSLMEGKAVVVTGAGGGIGRDIALAMAAAGASVVVNDIGTSTNGIGRDHGPAQGVVEEIRATGGTATPSCHSVADPGSADAIVQTAIDEFGRIDAVVNNAGILRDRIFFKMTLDEWRPVIDVHLNGSFLVSRAAAKHFKEQGFGAFVSMTSTSGLIGNFGQANYAAAKLGIVGLSRSIALDMARYHVRSNCVAPFAWSRMIGSIPDSPDETERLARMRVMETSKIAPLVVYLTSDLADGVTGQVFGVRANELFVFSQPRPIRSVHRSEGWTPETIAAHAMPALSGNATALERTSDVFSWDPI
jgi:NAD(P)-dependent dehydrogenase (short-subunit alcohol dehydrogenase family)